MDPAEFGLLGKLEAVRQALEAAGSEGMTGAEVRAVIGMPRRGSWPTFLMNLTAYCAVYEEEQPNSVTRYYLNMDMDEDFDRRLTVSQDRSFFDFDFCTNKEKPEWLDEF